MKYAKNDKPNEGVPFHGVMKITRVETIPLEPAEEGRTVGQQVDEMLEHLRYDCNQVQKLEFVFNRHEIPNQN